MVHLPLILGLNQTLYEIELDVEILSTIACGGTFELLAKFIVSTVDVLFPGSQTAFKSTTMSRVKMTFHWDYDIQYTNYELFK